MSKIKLKPGTSYGFTPEDYEFILELTKVGAVHILSHQVQLLDINVGKTNTPTGHGFGFKDVSQSKNPCNGLTLPDGWVIENIYTMDCGTSITFGVSHN